MRIIDLKNVVWKESKYYVAWNLNTGVSSFGDNKKGSHTRYEVTKERTHKVTIKVGKKEIPHGTFMSILLHSGLKESDFRDEK